MSNSKSATAIKSIEGLWNNPSQALIIHYSRQNLMDNESGTKTPRVVAIIIRSLDGQHSACFAIHLEAERNRVIFENIADRYDDLEYNMLIAFISFVKKNKNCNWIHWNMNEVHFSFEAIKHRYEALAEKDEWKNFEEIPLQNRVNLNLLLTKIYGNKYEIEPAFENLMKSNNGGVCKADYLTLEDESRAFQNLEFPSILKSLECKVNFQLEILEKTLAETLTVGATASSKKHKPASNENPILSLIKSGTFWTVIVLAVGVSFSLGIYFGTAKFDKEKIDLYNESKILKDSSAILTKQNTKLKSENDSLKLKQGK